MSLPCTQIFLADTRWEIPGHARLNHKDRRILLSEAAGRLPAVDSGFHGDADGSPHRSEVVVYFALIAEISRNENSPDLCEQGRNGAVRFLYLFPWRRPPLQKKTGLDKATSTRGDC